jgi:hypothetical protein
MRSAECGNRREFKERKMGSEKWLSGLVFCGFPKITFKSSSILLLINILYQSYRATSLIFNRQPTASAYRRRVEMDGECFFLPPPDSIRAMAGVLVPIRFATCSWVSPARFRALSSSSSKINFSENRL